MMEAHLLPLIRLELGSEPRSWAVLTTPTRPVALPDVEEAGQHTDEWLFTKVYLQNHG